MRLLLLCSSQAVEVATLKTDNVKLYEKIKYLRAYGQSSMQVWLDAYRLCVFACSPCGFWVLHLLRVAVLRVWHTVRRWTQRSSGGKKSTTKASTHSRRSKGRPPMQQPTGQLLQRPTDGCASTGAAYDTAATHNCAERTSGRSRCQPTAAARPLVRRGRLRTERIVLYVAIKLLTAACVVLHIAGVKLYAARYLLHLAYRMLHVACYLLRSVVRCTPHVACSQAVCCLLYAACRVCGVFDVACRVFHAACFVACRFELCVLHTGTTGSCSSTGFHRPSGLCSASRASSSHIRPRASLHSCMPSHTPHRNVCVD